MKSMIIKVPTAASTSNANAGKPTTAIATRMWNNTLIGFNQLTKAPMRKAIVSGTVKIPNAKKSGASVTAVYA